MVDDDNDDTHLASFTISFKSVNAVVVGRPEAKKHTELLTRVNTKLLVIIMSCNSVIMTLSWDELSL